jgi:hypothetical protein
MNKAQSLWFLLNKIDRENQSVLRHIELDKEKYPFFYLLKWNESYSGIEQKKIALQSFHRVNYYFSIIDAPDYMPKNNLVQSDQDLAQLSQNDLIDRFLINLPSISKPKKDFKDFEQDDKQISEENETFFPVGKIFTMTHEEFMNHPEINKDGQPLLWGYEDMRTATFCYSKAKMDSEFCFSN